MTVHQPVTLFFTKNCIYHITFVQLAQFVQLRERRENWYCTFCISGLIRDNMITAVGNQDPLAINSHHYARGDRG